jgi:prepilin-type processing-associated H-X9-DG protein
MSNMKQIALGWLMYTQDYDGKLPYFDYDGSEMAKVSPYVKSRQIFLCPSANLPLASTYDPTSSAAGAVYGTEYGMPAIYASTGGNAALYNITNGAGTINGSVAIMDTIPQPAITCLLAETVRTIGSLANQVGYDRFRANPASPLDITTDTGFDGVVDVARHFDGSNYAFMDGHVKWLKKEVALTPHAQNQAIIFYWN